MRSLALLLAFVACKHGAPAGGASAAQESGTTGKGHVFFEGPVVYSYGRHFPMAMFIKDARGNDQVLVNESRYSVSTSKHQTYVRQALHKYRPSLEPIYVSTETFQITTHRLGLHYVSTPQIIVGYLIAEARKLIEPWSKARSQKPRYEERVMALMSTVNRVCELWNMTDRYPDDFESARLAIALGIEQGE